MAGVILALNAGSSSLKAALFEGGAEPKAIASTKIDSGAGAEQAITAALDWMGSAAAGRALAAAGHRVVHGGANFHDPVRLTPAIIDAIEALTPLAPLHQPQCVDAVRALARLRPDLPQVACFDTAFHWSQPPVAQRLGLPRALHDQGVRRYGFHGLSYEHVADRLKALDPWLAAGKVVAAHLGSGASLCAMAAGKSVETTMGFSPLDGLLMSTRCGTLDPGAVLYLLQHQGMAAQQIQDLLYRQSGLLGVSGLSGDMRVLLASPERAAAEAVELFVHRAAREIGALAVSLGGLDGLVFTGGVGENSAEIRGRIAARLSWLGLETAEVPQDRTGERRISTGSSRIAAWVLPADEEIVIARHAVAALGFPRP